MLVRRGMEAMPTRGMPALAAAVATVACLCAPTQALARVRATSTVTFARLGGLPHGTTGKLTLVAKRMSRGRLRVHATAIITMKGRKRQTKHVRSIPAQFEIFACLASIDPNEIPFTGPTLFFTGTDQIKNVSIRETPGTQRFRMKGIANVGAFGGGWTDCADANIYPDKGPDVLFTPDATDVLTTENDNGQHVPYPPLPTTASSGG